MAPVWDFGVVVGLEENPAVSLFRILLFLVLAVCCVATSTWWLSERTSPRSMAPLGGAMLLGVPLILGAVAINQSPELIRHEAHPISQCQRAEGIDICVHGAKAVLLPDLISSVEAVHTAWGLEGFPLFRVLDTVLWIEPSPPRVITIDLQTQDSDGPRNAAIQDLAWMPAIGSNGWHPDHRLSRFRA